MLRYIKENMTTIDGIEIWPIISLVIFFSFFAGLLWWVYKSDKDTIEEIKQIPLKED